MPRRQSSVRSYRKRDGTYVQRYTRLLEGRKDATPNFDMTKCIKTISKNAGVQSAGAVCRAMFQKWKRGEIKHNPFPQR